jgi:hypothetical protein
VRYGEDYIGAYLVRNKALLGVKMDRYIDRALSHDNFVTEHPYGESNTFQGIHVRSIITLGLCLRYTDIKWRLEVLRLRSMGLDCPNTMGNILATNLSFYTSQ